MLVADSELQEEPMHADEWPARAEAVDDRRRRRIGAVPNCRAWLVAAEKPVIVADRAARTPRASRGWSSSPRCSGAA